ncbi:hypothetical protein [Paractinoplanes durhamensis]|uniref:hypothetical protein n=1 Tax=Paractinoplanes durhamensis TaxID=113563 RepID=UPI00363F11CA
MDVTPRDADTRWWCAAKPVADAGLVEDRLRAKGFAFTARSTWSSRWAPTSTSTSPSRATRLSAKSRVRDGADAKIWMNLDKIYLFDPRDGRDITVADEKTGAHAA